MPKSPRIIISITSQQRDALHKAAAARGCKSTSDMIRNIVFDVLDIEDDLTPWGKGRLGEEHKGASG